MPDTERNLVQQAGEKVALVYDDLRSAREKITRLEVENDHQNIRVQDLEADKRGLLMEVELLKQERESFVTSVGAAKIMLDEAFASAQKALLRRDKPLPVIQQSDPLDKSIAASLTALAQQQGTAGRA